MRIAVLGDIHANLEALVVVGRDIESVGVDRVVCVGDLVGYNAFPSKCIELIRRFSHATVAGNHDLALVGSLPLERFSSTAAEALRWTEENITAEAVEYLEELPMTVTLEEADVCVCHSMPHDPEGFPYVFVDDNPVEAFDAAPARVTFVGHTHQATVFRPDGNNEELTEGTVDIGGPDKVIVNVGSVGQPRDRDPRTGWALYDTDTGKLTLKRMDYDINRAVARINQTGLPAGLGDRLRLGK